MPGPLPVLHQPRETHPGKTRASVPATSIHHPASSHSHLIFQACYHVYVHTDFSSLSKIPVHSRAVDERDSTAHVA